MKEIIEWFDVAVATPPVDLPLLIDVAPSCGSIDAEESPCCVAYYLPPDEGFGAAWMTLEGTALAVESVVHWAYAPKGPRGGIAELESPVGFHRRAA